MGLDKADRFDGVGKFHDRLLWLSEFEFSLYLVGWMRKDYLR
jgi:hypothetical protein